MNAIGWSVEDGVNGEWIYALCGDTILVLSAPHRDDEVWQFCPCDGPSTARGWLIEETDKIEHDGGRLKNDPVEFVLSDEALMEIAASDPGVWRHAPHLRAELLQAVHGPKIIMTSITHAPWGAWSAVTGSSAPSLGDIYYNPTSGVVSTFNGTTWTGLES